MSGSQLTVAIFFWGSAVVIGLDAMKADGLRAKVLWALTAAFGVAGFLVRPLWELFPDVSAALVELVRSPVAWFGLSALAYLVLRSPPPPADGPRTTADDLRQFVRDELVRNSVATTGAEVEPAPPPPSKPKLKLSTAEQERLTDRMIKLDDYLTGDLSLELQPFIDLLDWSELLRFSGARALHEKIEAPRVGLTDRIRKIGQTLKAHDEQTAVLNLRPVFIKTRLLPIEQALWDLSAVTEVLPPDSINNAPLRLPATNYSKIVTEITEEVARVRGEIAGWRKKIAEGQLD